MIIDCDVCGRIVAEFDSENYEIEKVICENCYKQKEYELRVRKTELEICYEEIKQLHKLCQENGISISIDEIDWKDDS
jgi:hypothetical protein